MGNWASGIGHQELGIGNWASGIGHRAWGIENCLLSLTTNNN
ncbi:hypothetical protein [Microcoleus anatoxicus]|uniref:Uncharacterized protein n=1 Tax=Microcoleus anatoxicus PTRS2 TaxID=2705321 RepID=A0ABU8YWM9_9CYAN